MSEFHLGERRIRVLPEPTLAAFADVAYGVTVPSGAAKHWCEVAKWQLAGHAQVKVTSAAGEPAGLVTITKAGKRVAETMRLAAEKAKTRAIVGSMGTTVAVPEWIATEMGLI